MLMNVKKKWLYSMLCGGRSHLNVQVVIIKLLRQPYVSKRMVSRSSQTPFVIELRSVGVSLYVGRLFQDLGIVGFLDCAVVGRILGRFSVWYTRLPILWPWLSCSSSYFTQIFSGASVNNNTKDNQKDQSANCTSNNCPNVALLLLG